MAGLGYGRSWVRLKMWSSQTQIGWFSAMSAAYLDFEFGMVCLFFRKERLNSDEPSLLDNWIFNIYIMGEKERRSTINSTTTSHLKSLSKTPDIGLWKTRSYSLLFQRVSNMEIQPLKI